MITDSEYKEARFDLYCAACKHALLDDTEEPCAECLDNATNLYSNRPVKWERGKMTVNQAYDILNNYTKSDKVPIYEKYIIGIIGEDMFKALKDKGYLEKCGSAFGKDQYMLVEREDK